MSSRNSLVVLALVVLAFVFSPVMSTQAGLIVNIDQSGNDVVINFSGNADTRGLLAPANGVSSPTLRINGWAFGTSTFNVPTSRFGGITNPPAYPYTGIDILTPNSGSGDRLGVLPTLGLLVLPRGYVSGTQISGTSTFNNSTLQSLNLTLGTRIWSWGSVADGNADTLVMNIGVISSVPEPSSMALLSIGAIGLAMKRRRKRLDC